MQKRVRKLRGRRVEGPIEARSLGTLPSVNTTLDWSQRYMNTTEYSALNLADQKCIILYCIVCNCMKIILFIVATDHKWRSAQKSAMQEDHTTDHGKKTKLVWTQSCHMQDETGWWKRWCLERLKENRGEEDRAENGWMTSRSGVERTFTYSTEKRRI